MKVVILGAGAVGEVIAKSIKDCPDIEQVTLADIREDRVKAVVAQIADGRYRAERVDASSIEDLKQLLRGFDLVVNAGPPRFNCNVLDAAVAVRCNYMDLAANTAIASRPEDLYQSQQTASELAYDHEFKAIDRCALLFMGADPGLTNVFARYGADQMDEVHEILIRDGDNSVVEGYAIAPLWSPDVAIEECAQNPEQWVDGKFIVLNPLEDAELFNFPEPVGKMKVYSVAHEEVGTLPIFLNKGGTLKRVDFKLALSDLWVTAERIFVKLGLHNASPIDVGGSEVSPRTVITALLPRPEDLAGKAKGWSCIGTIVKGKKGNALKSIYTYMLNSQDEAYERMGVTVTVFHVGIPAASVVELMAEGKITKKGAFPPEVLDPIPIMQKCIEHGISIYVDEKTIKPFSINDGPKEVG